jgi:phenylacetate-CoA ligase
MPKQKQLFFTVTYASLSKIARENIPPLLSRLMREAAFYCKSRHYFWMKRLHYLPLEQVKKWQNKRLRELVRHCYENIPYYKKLFKRLNLAPEDIQTIEDLRKLPILTKEDIIKYHREFFADTTTKSALIKKSTSGTTGTPLEVYMTPKEEFHCFYTPYVLSVNMTGCDFFEGKVIIYPLEERGNTKNDIWNRELLVSPYILNDKYLPLIVEEIKKTQYPLIIGRPSLIGAIGTYCLNTNTKVTFKAAISIGEHLLPSHRRTIRQAFSCETFDMYGQMELSVRAIECPSHKGMHIHPWLSIVEATDRGLIATPLLKRVFPLLRYETKDHAVIDYTKCKCCRTSPRIIALQGREGDVLIGKDGSIFHTYSLFAHLKLPQGWVREVQFVQKKDGKVVVFVTILNQDAKGKVMRRVKGKLGKFFPLQFRFVRFVPRTEGGKLRLIRSEVKTPYYNLNQKGFRLKN